MADKIVVVQDRSLVVLDVTGGKRTNSPIRVSGPAVEFLR
jgi:hypothetical protein